MNKRKALKNDTLFLKNDTLLKIGRQLRAFIPLHVSSKLVLGTLEFLRTLHRHLGRDYRGHLSENEKKIREGHSESIAKNGGFIEDQFRYHDVMLGLATMAYAGCEVIALYNALQALQISSGRQDSGEKNAAHHSPASPGHPAGALSEMIASFEKDGILLSGRFGTSPKALCDYLNRLGLTAFLTPLHKDSFRTGENLPTSTETDPQGDCYILTYYNNGRNIADQVHTICITKNDQGKLVGHNLSGGRATPPRDTIPEMLRKAHQGHAVGIALITILFPS